MCVTVHACMHPVTTNVSTSDLWFFYLRGNVHLSSFFSRSTPLTISRFLFDSGVINPK